MLKSEVLNKIAHIMNMNYLGAYDDKSAAIIARMEAPFILMELEQAGVKIEYTDDIGDDEEKLFGRG